MADNSPPSLRSACAFQKCEFHLHKTVGGGVCLTEHSARLSTQVTSRGKEIIMKLKAPGLVALILTVAVLGQVFVRATGAQKEQPSDSARIAHLETLLESLRQELKIPAYSAAIVKDQKVIWAKGFGYADVENKIPATEHTAYHLASLTKTFASTILMHVGAGRKDQAGRSCFKVRHHA